ncbi:hypothetical protein [Nitrospira moscoviensis]|uniref:Uncharacterized protein n=1 Tax=Nitrospira moscoviensis TaxID=42253 RepID=A0A0K2GF55_NITMO|nr:hypothetical protein [Nitrospira moscoviensis]ALA59474.1 hypothetical protein NITMOv2_3075 [Nitrospira moscoviensis]
MGNGSGEVKASPVSDGALPVGPIDGTQVSNALQPPSESSSDTGKRIRIRMYCEEVDTLFVRAEAECPEAVPFMYQRACRYGMASQRWVKTEKQIEMWLRKNYRTMPTRIADYLIAYHKIDPRMKPFLINLARKVKARFRMRRNRGIIEVRVVDGKEQLCDVGQTAVSRRDVDP